MDETPASLDDLALFAQVAQSGSLSAAARQAQMPLPTLSRRMNALERQLGRSLFLRGSQGYSLTADGRTLAAELSGLTETRHRVARWCQARTGPHPVRITAGTWTARHLALHLPQPMDTWTPVFLPSNARLDLARREADLGLRNAAPDHPWLARRRLSEVQFALFGQPAVTGIIGGPKGTPSQDWLYATYGKGITLTASDPRLCLDLALAGRGQVLLPTFAARGTGLVQHSEIIEELTHDAWLVMHQDARHDPPIRAAIAAIIALF